MLKIELEKQLDAANSLIRTFRHHQDDVKRELKSKDLEIEGINQHLKMFKDSEDAIRRSILAMLNTKYPMDDKGEPSYPCDEQRFLSYLLELIGSDHQPYSTFRERL